MMLSGHVVPLLRLCNRTGLLSCSITPQVYIPWMSPRNHTTRIGNYYTAVLIITPAACWHSSG